MPVSKQSVVDFAEIRRRRLAAHLTMEACVKRVAWPGKAARTRWADIEAGRFLDPRVSTLVDVAEALDCSVADLLVKRRR